MSLPFPSRSTQRPAPGGVAPRRRLWYLVLLLPFAATLVPPFYARQEPSVGGWPFFYWWQFAWIVITALLLALVYRATTPRSRGRARRSAVGPR